MFRSTFVGILLGPNAGILTNWLWSFLNAGVQVRCPACCGLRASCWCPDLC